MEPASSQRHRWVLDPLRHDGGNAFMSPRPHFEHQDVRHDDTADVNKSAWILSGIAGPDGAFGKQFQRNAGKEDTSQGMAPWGASKCFKKTDWPPESRADACRGRPGWLQRWPTSTVSFSNHPPTASLRPSQAREMHCPLPEGIAGRLQEPLHRSDVIRW
ncbi:uncharacterized protein LOC125117727 isoform X2 [Phacochoerus africanus]|uniref:uncharacterized protein LOC125117727 isoform X2 n=1 Tax=Phacochoerus africanus TaxID=41426 RepID=UPI001FDAA5F0|nr:uncharacterized protein LOC125117727 isoform X2 [Phacochoerus africanus]